MKDEFNKVRNLVKTSEEEEIIKRKKNLLKFVFLIIIDEYCFDGIEIPYIDVLEDILIYKFRKIVRDKDKLISLIRIISAWNYRIRESFEINNKNILISHPNDLIIALEYGIKIFREMSINISVEKNKIIDLITDLTDDKHKWFSTNQIHEQRIKNEGYSRHPRTLRNLLNALSYDGYLAKERKGRSSIYKLQCQAILKDIDIEDLIKKANHIYQARINELKSTGISLKEYEIYSIENSLDISIYERIVQFFKNSKLNKLPIDHVIQNLTFDKEYSEEEINHQITILIKKKFFKKNWDEELIYKEEQKDGGGRGGLKGKD